MTNFNKLERIVDSWTAIKEDLKKLYGNQVKKKKQQRPPELYCRPWESIVIKPKKK